MSGVRCRIRVLDAGGQPVPDAFIQIAAAETALPEMSYVTGSDGTVSISLPVGQIAVEAFAGDRTGRTSAKPEVGDEPCWIEVQLREPDN